MVDIPTVQHANYHWATIKMLKTPGIGRECIPTHSEEDGWEGEEKAKDQSWRIPKLYILGSPHLQLEANRFFGRGVRKKRSLD